MAGRHQTLSEGQEREVARLLWRQILGASLVVLALLGGITGLSLWGIKGRLEKNMEDLVADQFKEPRIRAVVSNVAANKAEALLLEQITPQIAAFKADIAGQVKETKVLMTSTHAQLKDLSLLIASSSHDAKESITELEKQIQHLQGMEKELQATLDDAQAALKTLRTQTEFTILSLAAQSDDREAYNSLGKLAQDPQHPLASGARNVQDLIQRSYCGWMGDKAYKTIQWNEDINPHSLTMPEIKRIWEHEIPQDQARGFVEYVWGHKYLTKEAKLSFLHDVLANSKNSLQAADKAARLLSEEGKVKYNPPFNFSHIEKWWGERSTNQVP